MFDEKDINNGFEHTENESVEQEASVQGSSQVGNDGGGDEWKEKFLRVTADFENYKRRMVKERAQWGNSAQVEMLLALLPIANNIDRALVEQQAKGQPSPELQAWFIGFELIAKSMHKFLQQFEVEAIDCSGSFDPEMHEALMHVDAENVPSGNIVQVLEPGYLFKKTVLKPAKVSVAK